MFRASDYGLWSLVIVNSLVFLVFAFSFAKPSRARDWRSFGAFSGLVVALFTVMYGFPSQVRAKARTATVIGFSKETAAVRPCEPLRIEPSGQNPCT